jgi:DNA end-binding protein Ku
MRPLWEGAITFGLILIPVRMYKATEERKPGFHLVREKDMCPIKYMRICKASGEEVPYNEIVRSYEYQKGNLITLDDEDFKKAYARRTENIEIIQFSAESEIQSKYYQQPYYLEPGKAAAKVYALLREALVKSNKVGIARYVLHNLEHLGVIKAEGGLLILNQIRYASEIREISGLRAPEKTDKISEKEIDTALMLVKQLSSPFNPKKFKDTFTKEMNRVIEEKVKTGGIRIEDEKKYEKPGEVVDLLAKLKQSLDEAGSVKNAS